MILEYLAHSGFDRAVNELKQQLRERRMGKQQAWRPVGRDVQTTLRERMLKALDRGDRGEVFKLWENFVPPLVRRSDREAQKLEFYLNVFFAIFPLHPSNASPDPTGLTASMSTFKVSPSIVAFHHRTWPPQPILLRPVPPKLVLPSDPTPSHRIASRSVPLHPIPSHLTPSHGTPFHTVA